MSFEEEMALLCECYPYGHFQYVQGVERWSMVVNDHFANMQFPARFGVYLVRRSDVNEVIYIGRAGCITGKGSIKKQDIPSRLKARRGKLSANRWFRELRDAEGDLELEYIILERSPMSPALAEAILLQAFLNEYGVLPKYNKLF
jgi:hypothetical protein